MAKHDPRPGLHSPACADGCWMPIALPENAIDGQSLIYDSTSPLQLSWGPIAKGDTGPAGPQGIPGRDGINGTNGRDGLPGQNGLAGAQGVQGVPGRDGVNGINGLNGRDGQPGATPQIGPNNTWIIAGFDTGQPSKGVDGINGKNGAMGPVGATGSAGRQGPQGPTGPAGSVGPEGPAGPAGEAGPTGPAGPAGDPGADGVGIPAGGTIGQLLAKKFSGIDYQAEWIDPPIFVSNQSGQVKIRYTNFVATGFTANGTISPSVRAATAAESPAPTTLWPQKAIADGTDNYDADFYVQGPDETADRFRENNILGQVHRWRVAGNYTAKDIGNQGRLRCLLQNPDTGFKVSSAVILPSGITDDDFTFEFTSIADSDSLGAGRGYQLGFQTSFDDATLTLSINSIVRISEAIDPLR